MYKFALTLTKNYTVQNYCTLVCANCNTDFADLVPCSCFSCSLHGHTHTHVHTQSLCIHTFPEFFATLGCATDSHDGDRYKQQSNFAAAVFFCCRCFVRGFFKQTIVSLQDFFFFFFFIHRHSVLHGLPIVRFFYVGFSGRLEG